jgi:hypothetical protein
MKMSSCEMVAERVALGEPLGELATHATECAGCRALVALPVELGAASRHEVEPGAGFSSRIAAGAQRRIGQRRRRRVAFASAAIAVTAAASLAIVVRGPNAARQDEPVPPSTATASAEPLAPTAPAHAIEAQPISTGSDDADLRALVHFARYERASHASARWAQISKPLAPYRQLVAGVRP